MWKQFFELFRQVLTITEDVQRNRAEIRELREQHQALTIFVHKLAAKIERVESDDKHEREKMLLQLQNALLQFERRLPPASTD
jgi:hypothetical protein